MLAKSRITLCAPLHASCLWPYMSCNNNGSSSEADDSQFLLSASSQYTAFRVDALLTTLAVSAPEGFRAFQHLCYGCDRSFLATSGCHTFQKLTGGITLHPMNPHHGGRFAASRAQLNHPSMMRVCVEDPHHPSFLCDPTPHALKCPVKRSVAFHA